MKQLLLYFFTLASFTSYSQENSNDIEEIKSVIIEETKENGKLDFFTPIKGKEYDGYQVKPGLYASNREMALYNWAKAVKDLGVNDLEELYILYAEARNKEITTMEKDLLKMGFNKELE